MNIVRDLYLGWTRLEHGQDCPLPVWEPQLRMDEGRRGRLNVGDDPHACTAEDCGHANLFGRFTVRLVCRSCEAVHIISGEDVGIYSTTAAAYGYGQAPREVEGLWLWAGAQIVPGRGGEPREYLVTLTPRLPAQAADIAGTICHYRTAGQHPRWQASAVADPDGPYGDATLRWARRRTELRTIEKAAAWIATQYQPETLEVAV